MCSAITRREEQFNAPISAKDVCIRPLLDSRVRSHSGTRGQGSFKNALKWIGERCIERLHGLRKTLLVHSKEHHLLRRSGKTSLAVGGIVRKVPKKPARMGIKLLLPS